MKYSIYLLHVPINICRLECVALLRSLKVNAVVIDFDQLCLKLPIQKVLGQWIVNYFDKLRDSVCVPPLYLQWEGHSVTVIGYEQKQDNLSILHFDPARNPSRILCALEIKTGWQKYVKRGIQTFKLDKYQIVCILPNSASYCSHEDKTIRGMKPTDDLPF